MASLWKRASPVETRMLRIVCGAVLNTFDAHPGKYQIDSQFARGVAKRAVGTLSAQWSDVLAVGFGRPSEARSDSGYPGRRPRANPVEARGKRGGRQRDSLAPLVRAEKDLAARVNPAKAAGEHERAAALIEALIVLGTHRKRAERADKTEREAAEA